ncbi:MAG: NADH-quinone oxidoreductase subunit NuoE [Planctomycetes bacterium]|nr:NADH-quinone oxidoreductase subunit NuoE [Planctomycetota bacterium]
MLTDEEKREIDEELAKYRTKRAAGPEALKIVQKYRGWISDESLRDVARYLELSDEELDSVATCYNFIFRRPVGRHLILLCDSVTCWVVGYEDLRARIEQRLGIQMGQTTPDGRFTLLPAACLGACDRAPVMMIDEQLYVELSPAKVDEILDTYR